MDGNHPRDVLSTGRFRRERSERRVGFSAPVEIATTPWSRSPQPSAIMVLSTTGALRRCGRSTYRESGEGHPPSSCHVAPCRIKGGPSRTVHAVVSRRNPAIADQREDLDRSPFAHPDLHGIRGVVWIPAMPGSGIVRWKTVPGRSHLSAEASAAHRPRRFVNDHGARASKNRLSPLANRRTFPLLTGNAWKKRYSGIRRRWT